MIGTRAVVVGAGMGGLPAARAVAGHFEQVLVLEQDALPRDSGNRVGVPQGRHVHAVLAGGQRALAALFPGFEDDLVEAGAVPIRIDLDIRTERFGYDPFPQRDLGWVAYALSRATLERTVRRRVEACANIEVRPRCRVQAFVAREDRTAVTGVRYVDGNGKTDTVNADLVVDASGRGALTSTLLESIGHPRPEESTIGIDVNYASAVFAIPDDASSDWKGVFCLPAPTRSGHGALLLPLEGNRWIVTLAGRHGDKPPGDEAGFMAYARGLRTPTVYDAIKHAKRLGEIARFGFPASVWRHYERQDHFPRGLLALGDAVCRFNPVYGQGMSVAALEARALGNLLTQRTADRDPLHGLAPAFFTEASAVIDGPWATSAIPDFVHPETRGERPANLEQTLQIRRAVFRLAAEDPAVHTLVAEVQHLLKPRSAVQDPELLQRVLPLLADD